MPPDAVGVMPLNHERLSPFSFKTLDELTQSFLEKEKPQSTPVKAPAKNEYSQDTLDNISEAFANREKSSNRQAASIITEKQLRALGKKHLLIMIRDLEKELLLLQRENKNLLLAYETELAQKQLRAK